MDSSMDEVKLAQPETKIAYAVFLCRRIQLAVIYRGHGQINALKNKDEQAKCYDCLYRRA